MSYTLEYLTKDSKQISDLAEVYGRSYNLLSAQYKSKEEMALYTPTYFEQRVKRFAEDEKSTTLVAIEEGKPVGFARFSPVSESYLTLTKGVTFYPEKGKMDGFEYQWLREMRMFNQPQINEKTLMLHQIYLAPGAQHKGLGTQIFASVLPKMEEKFDKVLVEFNLANTKARQFYVNLGFKIIGMTQDLDHILPSDSPWGCKFCVSDVGMAATPLKTLHENAVKKLETRKLPLLKIRQQHERN